MISTRYAHLAELLRSDAEDLMRQETLELKGVVPNYTRCRQLRLEAASCVIAAHQLEEIAAGKRPLPAAGEDR